MTAPQTIFNVHLHREMYLYYPRISAPSAEEAARIASQMPASEAETIEDCDGDNIAAVIDVAGDTDYAKSMVVDFEPARLQKSAAVMLQALREVLLALTHHRQWQPSMPAHLIGEIQAVINTATNQ